MYVLRSLTFPETELHEMDKIRKMIGRVLKEQTHEQKITEQKDKKARTTYLREVPILPFRSRIKIQGSNGTAAGISPAAVPYLQISAAQTSFSETLYALKKSLHFRFLPVVRIWCGLPYVRIPHTKKMSPLGHFNERCGESCCLYYIHSSR